MSAVAPRQHAGAAAVWALTAVMAVGGVVLTILAWDDLVTGDAISNLCALPAAVLYATLGALIVRRAGNVIGWYLLGEGIATAILGLASAYAVLGVENPGTLPEPRIVGLLAEWSFVPLVCGLAFMFLLFPTGHLPCRRWRPVGALGLLVIALTMAGFLIHPRKVALPAPGGISLTIQNPIGVRSLPSPLATVLIGTMNGLSTVLIALLAASIVAITLRYRSGGRELRQQIKWIAFTTAAAIACAVVALASLEITGKPSTVPSTAAYAALMVIGLAGFPVAIAVAILKHGLYQIDVIINRAVSYGLLSAVLTSVYAGIVLGIGTLAGYTGGPLLTAAAVAVAVLFQPARNRATLLLTDLASQAGLVLRNVRLTAELQARIDDLRASRRRLVQAQDDERQRIERNLHDGAQQQLVALTVQLTLLDEAASDPGEVRELTAQLRSGLRAALDDLRSLARGIYPPLLADQGLRAALRAQADRAPMPVLVDADGIGRFSRDAEATLYFCILEALQNVAKYAQASLATVTLTQVDATLEFSVTDDGAGFDPAAAAHGTGLQGMTDRLSAMGGQLRIESAPGRGTIVTGTVPAIALATCPPGQ
jgi:signal transduction histidine kinase